MAGLDALKEALSSSGLAAAFAPTELAGGVGTEAICDTKANVCNTKAANCNSNGAVCNTCAAVCTGGINAAVCNTQGAVCNGSKSECAS